MDFFPEIKLDEAQAEAIARGLFAVARSDGMHEREAALVASFLADVGGRASALADLERQPAIQGAELAKLLQGAELRLLFLKSALLLAWADGRCSTEERATIDGFAKDLEATAKVEQLEAAVKEYLLSHVAGLQNSDAAAAVAKEMKV
jgi:tellurite resistance protein